VQVPPKLMYHAHVANGRQHNRYMIPKTYKEKTPNHDEVNGTGKRARIRSRSMARGDGFKHLSLSAV
jgi:hypothetical protein